MGNLEGEAKSGGLKLHFDARLRFEFRGARVTTDTCILPMRELDGALVITEMAGVAVPGGLFARVLAETEAFNATVGRSIMGKGENRCLDISACL